MPYAGRFIKQCNAALGSGGNALEEETGGNGWLPAPWLRELQRIQVAGANARNSWVILL